MDPCKCWLSISIYEDGFTWNEAINMPYIIQLTLEMPVLQMIALAHAQLPIVPNQHLAC